ncbi:hypothetical protein GALMADRAFT_234933 [Galerina marginata CBS 339.88]|uniref:Late embryogenesis abundant protein LEA-2 subgroup domain-containing protein n=1 Tax=Galerina marginata (strain CBS 339.88) TaxID=685588 RepID=A0A067U348_GALM3|nr:hypothetical protein GALMADRAFT_234933 [Galerina marginata CBS 339.88]
MARIGAFIFALFASLLLTVGATPTDIENRDLIAGIINGLGIGLVAKIDAFITLDSLETNLISVDVDIKNPLLLELTLTRVVSSAGINETVYATFDHTFDTPVVVPPFKTVNSGSIPDVLLVKGALNSLDIIPLEKLDLISTDVYLRAATIHGKLGIPLVIKGLKQSNVPTNYTLTLS